MISYTASSLVNATLCSFPYFDHFLSLASIDLVTHFGQPTRVKTPITFERWNGVYMIVKWGLDHWFSHRITNTINIFYTEGPKICFFDWTPYNQSPVGVQRFRSLRLYSLSASLTSLAWWLAWGACSTCWRFLSCLGSALSSVTSWTIRDTVCPKMACSAPMLVSVSSTVSWSKAAWGQLENTNISHDLPVNNTNS